MADHKASWVQVPDLDTGGVGQYYCSECKLQLDIGYNRHYAESATGWYWNIQDGDGQIIDSAGNEYVAKYEPAIGALDDVREEGLRAFDSLPCRRCN
jgi:hypothetical protein